MIVKIAVSAATYAIDKPYSYKIPEGMTLQPGQRVQLPFGRANKRTEGVVLTVETGNEEKLKAVERCLDEAPILSEHQLRLAAFLRERYFCTFYECLRVMLPAGLWFQARERISLTGDRSWKEKAIRKDGAAEVLALLENAAIPEAADGDRKSVADLVMEDHKGLSCYSIFAFFREHCPDRQRIYSFCIQIVKTLCVNLYGFVPLAFTGNPLRTVVKGESEA